MAPPGATATARVGEIATGRFSRLPSVPRPPGPGPRRHPIALLRAPHFFQVPDSARGSGSFPDPKPGDAQAWQTAAEISNPPTDGGPSGGPGQAAASAGPRHSLGESTISVPAGPRHPGNHLLLRIAHQRALRS